MLSSIFDNSFFVFNFYFTDNVVRFWLKYIIIDLKC